MIPSAHQTQHHSQFMGENTMKMEEHQALMDLVPKEDATHVATKNGSWFDPDIWKPKEVPGSDARVLIPTDINVTYDGESDARLNTLRLEGQLTFASQKNTKIVLDTLVETASGILNIGTEDEPIRPDKTAQILIAGLGEIDRNIDPTQIGRGVITMGEVNVYGADKTDFIALQRDAKAGDSELVLREVPTGWNVGDKLVLGGTNYRRNGSDADNSRFGDEELTITEIQGNRIRFTNKDITSGNNTVLRFDHTRPDLPEKNQLKLYVANTTRNVSFSTQNSDVPISQRGHIMFMHNHKVQVHNAGFYDLGRSDKTQLVDDPEQNVDGSVGSGTNRRGRYPIHFHRNEKNDAGGLSVVATGNAVVGSPGWGIAHHDGHVTLEDNVVFDVVGSAIVAEAGNETGAWHNNITIKTTGINTKQIQQQDIRRSERFDFGFNGESYWLQGAAQVAMTDNVAISANDSGVMVFADSFQPGKHFQEVTTIPTADLPNDIRRQVAPKGETRVDVTTVPLRQLSGFESYNTGSGIQFWGHLRNGDGELEFESQTITTAHTLRSDINDFKLWNIRKNGIKPQYSSSLDFNTGLILGADLSNRLPAFGGEKGIKQSEATYNVRYRDLVVKGFNEGMSIETLLTDKEYTTPSLEDSYFSGNTYNLSEAGSQYVPRRLVDDFTAFLRIENTTFEESPSNRVPVARFSTQAAGGLSVTFNAARSYDSDPLGAQNEKPKFTLPSKGIAAYGWDFDGDGKIDRFGRKITHQFSQSGAHDVTLHVWDNQGAKQTITETLEVSPTNYSNPFVDSSFRDETGFTQNTVVSSQWSGRGWFASDRVRRVNNTAVLSSQERRNSVISQVIQNNNVHQGQQTLSLRLKNRNGSLEPSHLNEISVQLWGINGQFAQDTRTSDGPYQVGSLPMSSQKLFEESIESNRVSASWEALEWDVNLGQGYQFLVVQIRGNGLDDEGDWVAVDDVRLTSSAENAAVDVVSSVAIKASEPISAYAEIAELNPSNGDALPQLVVQLNFGESEGKLASDSSVGGKNNSGILRANSDWDDGSLGGGVILNGQGDWIEIANSEDINLVTHTERTVSLWFKSDEKLNSDRKQVIYEEGGTARGLNIYTDAGRLYVGGWNNPKDESDWSGTWLKSDPILSPNSWNHVALVLDGSDSLAPDALKGYINGKEFASGEGSQLWRHSNGIGIGGTNAATRFHDGIDVSSNHSLSGGVDDVLIFNDALSANQIQSLLPSI